MSRRRYYHDGQNQKFKVRVKRILPAPFRYSQNWHKWVKFPLPKRISIVFTPDYVLFKKYNKKILEIPYDDISNWGDYGSKYWNFTWKLTDNTKFYINKNAYERYFNIYQLCIIYLSPTKQCEPKTFNNNMNNYKSCSNKTSVLRRRFTV